MSLLGLEVLEPILFEHQLVKGLTFVDSISTQGGHDKYIG
jgi:hypothetical protein